jgi:predicted NUDIX family NTP pyrophosphohydrolase
MRKSAGILLYRYTEVRQMSFFLVHPGGPFWKGKDAGAWSIPKGEYDQEEPLAAAIREFSEETGQVPEGAFIPLTPIKQKGGKEVRAWAVEGDFDPDKLVSNTFSMIWPPRSGKMQTFPEVDRGSWFLLPEAKEALNPAQHPFLDELLLKLKP